MIPPVYLSRSGALYAAYHPAFAAGFGRRTGSLRARSIGSRGPDLRNSNSAMRSLSAGMQSLSTSLWSPRKPHFKHVPSGTVNGSRGGMLLQAGAVPDQKVPV